MTTKPKLFMTIFLALSALPTVFARNSYIPALDQGIEMISGFFYPSILYQNEMVQVGFYKFLYFIIIFFTLIKF